MGWVAKKNVLLRRNLVLEAGRRNERKYDVRKMFHNEINVHSSLRLFGQTLTFSGNHREVNLRIYQ